MVKENGQLLAVCTGPTIVSLESGRHLHPGEVDLVDDSPRLRRAIDEGTVKLVEVKPATPIIKPEIEQEAT